MALLLAIGTRLATAANVIISDGTIRVRDANTLTLSSLFSDPDLTVPLTNPIPVNSAGYPTSNGTNTTGVYAADGEYDIAYLDSGGGLIGPSWEDVPALGDTGSEATHTLADDTRYKFAGSGGRVLLQVGDASPDNSGGKLTIEGWAGTQADEILLDAAAVKTTGTITENDKKLQGIVQTSSTSSGAATVIIALPNTNPVGCRVFDIDIIDIICASSGATTVEVSFDSGATYDATAYYSSVLKMPPGTGGTIDDDGGSSNAATAKIFTTAAGNAAASPATMQMRVVTPNTATGTVHITGRYNGGSQTGGEEGSHSSFHALQETNGGRATHIRLTWPGNVSCTYRVNPQRGFGE